MSGARHTLVIPVFNEEPVLHELHRRLTASLTDALAGRGETWGAIFVDDGSSDGTGAILKALRAQDPAHVRVVAFSRNFGHAAAMTAGIDHADGDTVITMDADLQDPPEVVLEMIARWREGFDVVYAVRTERRSETFFKKATAALFYRLLRASSEIEIPLDAGDFRLLSRRAALALAGLRERHRLLRGMSRWIGFRQTSVPYVRQARHAGETKFPVRRMARLAWDGLTSFSLLPLRIATMAGAVAALLGAVSGVWVIVARLASGPPLHRTAALIATMLVLGGLQLLALGVLGEYVGRLFEEIKRRPIYVVDHTLGFAGDGEAGAAPAR
jgi:glycosyltransferase involved in cell wall biosynthesis